MPTESKVPLIVKIFRRTDRSALLLRAGIIFVLSLLAFSSGKSAIETVVDRASINGDFVQDYLISKALLDNENIYQPLSQLADKYLSSSAGIFRHPSPHPPPVALLFTPFTYFDVHSALLLWFICEIVMVVGLILYLTTSYAVKFGSSLFVAIALLVLSSRPIFIELMYGQLSLIITLCLIFASSVSKASRSHKKGLLIGVAISLKPFLWPLFLLSVFQGDRRSWTVAGAVILALFGVATFVNPTSVLAYFGDSVPLNVSRLYLTEYGNYSLHSFASLFVGGVRPEIFSTPGVRPLIDRIDWVIPVSSVVGLAVLIYGIRTLWCYRNSKQSFALALSLSLLMTPLVWEHYFLLLIPGIIVMLSEGILSSPRPSQFRLFSTAVLLLLYGGGLLGAVKDHFEWPFSFWLGLLLRAPLLGLVIMHYQLLSVPTKNGDNYVNIPDKSLDSPL